MRAGTGEWRYLSSSNEGEVACLDSASVGIEEEGKPVADEVGRAPADDGRELEAEVVLEGFLG